MTTPPVTRAAINRERARARRKRRLVIASVLGTVLLGAAVATLALWPRPARASYVPRDPALRALPLYFYPAEGAAQGVIVFFGNDVGFWEAHQRLAQRLAGRGYDVIGFDVKKYLDHLPTRRGARERAFAAGVARIIPRAVHELHADSLPLVIGGHSFGADLALWVAARGAPPHTVGVLAVSATARSHFYVTALDRANLVEPTDETSFSVADDVAAVPASIRIAMLRGASDRRISQDSALRAAARAPLRYTVIPLANHSLKSLVIAGPMIGNAVDWLVSGR